MSEQVNHPECDPHFFQSVENRLIDPMRVLKNFAEIRRFPEHREILWSILKAVVASSKMNYTTVEEVTGWVLYCRQLEKLIEAVAVIAESDLQLAI